MKKLLGILVLGLILFVTTADAETKRDRLRTGEIYENEIIWTSKIRIVLPPGKWIVIEKWYDTYNALKAREAVLVQLEGKFSK